MDSVLMAQEALAALTPYLLWTAGKAAGAGVTEATKDLYALVKKSFAGKPAAAEALEAAQAEPEDATTLEILKLQIQKAAERDEEFRRGLQNALVVAGVGSDVQQTADVSGSGNKVAQVSGGGNTVNQ